MERDFSKGFNQQLLRKDVKLCMDEAAARMVPTWLDGEALRFLSLRRQSKRRRRGIGPSHPAP